jgi:hypothetical protein
MDLIGCSDVYEGYWYQHVSARAHGIIVFYLIISYRRTNAVHTLYASFPAIIYLNSTWGGWLLSPMLQLAQQNESQSLSDLGQSVCSSAYSGTLKAN